MEINKYITRIVCAAIAGLLSFSAGYAQVTKTDYFMKTSYLRNNLNPALRPDQGYLVVPILPTIGANVQMNSLNLDHLTAKGPNGQRVTFLHQSVDANKFLSDMSDDNYLNSDVNIKLFGLGLYKGDSYWNFDLGLRTHVDANLPKGIFSLLKNGFDQYGHSTYDLSDLSATGYSFIELGVSHSRLFMNNNLTLGTRIKVLGGLANFDLDAKSLEVEAGPDYWRAKSQVRLRGSAPGVRPEYDEKGQLDNFEFGDFGMSGYGLGLDIGAAYDLKEALPVLQGLKVSAAINDIGFISWSKSNSLDMYSPETEVKITPSDYSFNENVGSSLSDVFEDAYDDLNKAINLTGNNKGYSSSLRMNMILGAEYEFDEKLSVGALYSVRFGNYFNTSELTLSGNYQPCPWFATSLSYSAIHSNFDTFGLAVHIAPSKGMSLFLSSDYTLLHVSPEFIPTTSKGVNFQMGISIPLGKKTSSL